MSEYGKLWQQADLVRECLKKIVPGAKMDSIESAEKECEAHIKTIKRLLSEWRYYETKMNLIPEE